MANKVKKSLPLKNLMWERFCQCYVMNKTLFGNATRSYAHANNINLEELPDDDQVYEEIEDDAGHIVKKKVRESTYDRTVNSCAVNGNTLLRNHKIDARIRVLLRELISEDNADEELSWVINQREEMGPKVQAIKHLNEMKGRIVKKVELTGKDGERLFDDETKAKRKEALKGYISRR